jgi:hypothetical protein
MAAQEMTAPSLTQEKISWLEHKPYPDQQARDDLNRMPAELDRRLTAARNRAEKDAGGSPTSSIAEIRSCAGRLHRDQEPDCFE